MLRFLNNIFKKPENGAETPPIDLSDDSWYQNSDAISRGQSLKISAVWRAVKLISSSVGKLPIDVYARTEKGKEKALKHRAYNLLKHRPNSEMSAKTFRETLIMHVLLRGNGYAYISRDNAGRPRELILLDPDNTYPIRKNGKLYFITQTAKSMHKLFPENVFHIIGMGWDGLNGYSVLEYGANSMNMAFNSQKYSKKFFDNSAKPSVILEHPSTFDNENAIKRLRNQWNKLYTGVDNSHKTVILEQGMKASTLSLSARDSQLIESMKFSIVDIANWFSVPPHKLGDSSRTAYNSLEHENQSFLDECLDDWLVTFEQECWEKLLTERQKSADSHIIEFNRGALIRADLNARATYYQKATAGAPWMTIDEVRNKENMNNKGLNEIKLPTNNFGEKNASEEKPPEEKNNNQSDAVKAAEKALESEKQRMLKRIEKDYKNYVSKGKTTDFISSFEKRHGEILRNALTPPAEVLEILTGEKNIVKKIIEQIGREISG